jgi:hypothetical protein
VQQQQQQQRLQQPFAGAMGPRKVDPAVFGGSKGVRAKREGVVHVNSTANNTHLVLTDRASKVETWVSGGTVGYKNANKVGSQSGGARFVVLQGSCGCPWGSSSSKHQLQGKQGRIC